MLLVAIVGPPGSGKTTLAQRAAEKARNLGYSVSGFLAPAHGTRSPGASRYTVQFLPDGPELPFATRTDGFDVPYHFDPETTARVHAWAVAVAPSDVLFLDEFGKREARGEGWMTLWPALQVSSPKMAILCVREESATDVELHLGQPFDVRIHATSTDAEAQIARLFSTFSDWVQVAKTGLLGGGVEVSLGSVLHTFLVPARGLALVSIQAAVLQRGVHTLHQPSRIAWAGWISASAKALSPAGNRIRPMVAISMQAVWFGAAVHVLGTSWVGLTAGAFLMGVWAAVQGLFLQWVLAGEALFAAYASAQAQWLRLTGWALPSPSIFVAGWALLWGTCAAAAMWVLQHTKLNVLPQKALRPRSATRPALASPSLWISAGAVAGLLFVAGTPVVDISFVVARIFILSMILGLIVLKVQPDRLLRWARSRGWWGWVVMLHVSTGKDVEK